MLTNSRDVKRRLEKDVWVFERVTGSHHVFRNPKTGAMIPLPGVAEGLTRMTHYVAIVEEEEGKAVGVWFPDLPGCVSAGDSLDEAMTNAATALALWIDVAKEHGDEVPPPRALTELKRDPEIADDIARYMVALIEHNPLRQAA